MIGLKLYDTFVKIRRGSRLALQFPNPIFDNEIMQGDYSLPLDVSYKANAELFGFLEKTPLSVRQTLYDKAALYFKGIKLRRVMLDVNSVDIVNINTSLRLNLSSLPSMNTPLRSMDFGGLRDMGSNMADIIDFANTQIGDSWPAVDFNFPMVWNPDFYDGNNPDFQEYINNYEPGVGFYDNSLSNKNTLVPMAYLLYVITQGFANDGYTVDPNGFMDDSDMQKLIIYNNVALDQLSVSSYNNGMLARMTAPGGQAFVVQLTPEAVVFDTDNLGSLAYDPLSAYNNLTGEYTIQANGSHVISVNLFGHALNVSPGQPYAINMEIMLDSTVITSLAKQYTGQKTFGNFSGGGSGAFNILGYTFNAAIGDIGKKLWVRFQYAAAPPNANLGWNNVTLTIVSIATFFGINNFITTNSDNILQGQFDLRNHLPDITFGELLNAIKNTFNLVFRIDHIQKKILIEYGDQVLLSAPTDWSAKLTRGHRIEFNRDKVYRSFNFALGGDDDQEDTNALAFPTDKYLGSWNCMADMITAIGSPPQLEGYTVHLKEVNQIYKMVGGVWTFFCHAWYDQVVDDNGTVDQRPAVSPMFMHHVYVGGIPPDVLYVVPSILQKGTSLAFGTGENDFSLRLMFWDGHTSNGGRDMPFGTSTGFGMDGTRTHDTSLVWRTEELMRYWERFIALMARGEFFKMNMRLTLPDLVAFDIYRRIQADSQVFTIADMKIELGEELGEAELTLLRS